jgi:hypothetical protein
MISENLKKTIIGVVAAVLGVLVALGIFTPEQSEVAQQGVVGLLENVGGVILAVVGIWGIFTGGKDAAAE